MGKSDKQPKKRPGPKPDHLKLDEDDWESAVGKALTKKRPAEGWPDKGKKKSE